MQNFSRQEFFLTFCGRGGAFTLHVVTTQNRRQVEGAHGFVWSISREEAEKEKEGIHAEARYCDCLE